MRVVAQCRQRLVFSLEQCRGAGAGAHSHDGAALRGNMQRGPLLRQDDGIANMRHENAAAEQHMPGSPGQIGEHDGRIKGRGRAPSERGVMHPDEVEAHRLGFHSGANEVGQFISLAGNAGDVVERNPDANARAQVHVTAFEASYTR